MKQKKYKQMEDEATPETNETPEVKAEPQYPFSVSVLPTDAKVISFRKTDEGYSVVFETAKETKKVFIK